MFKNTGSQKLTVLAFADAGHASLDAGERVTGDLAQISLKIEQDDDGVRSASNDVSPVETEDGQYVFDLTQAETNGDKLTFYPESSTAGVQVVSLPSSVIYTRPPNFPAMGIETDGDVHADVKQWLGTAVNTPTVAGVPDVNAKTWNDLTTVALPLIPTIAGRTLDCSDGGEAGIDWANVGSPTSTVGLTNTTVGIVTLTTTATTLTNTVTLANGAQGGTSMVLTAERIVVASTTLNEPGIKATGDGTGDGMQLAGGASGYGLAAAGGSGGINANIDGNITGNLSGSVGSNASIATTGGAVDNVTTVATTTTNSDMRGTNSALLASTFSTMFAGITVLAQWLGLIAGKQTGNATARTEIRATGAGSGAYDETTDSQEAIRDRGDVGWITGGGGGITDILNVTPLIPESIDLADTATWRLGLMLTNAIDDLPTQAEITPGTISIDRKAIGGTSWSGVVSDAACSEIDGLIYFDEVFDSGTGYAEGDSIRITFKSQKVTVAANDYEIVGTTGRIFYTLVRETQRGTDGANTTTPLTAAGVRSAVGLASANLDTQLGAIPTTAMRGTDSASTHSAVDVRTEMDSNSTQLAAILNRIGDFAGTGLNTIKGFFQAMFRKDGGVTGANTPSEINEIENTITGTFDGTTESVQALKDLGDANWVTGNTTTPLTAAGIRSAVGMSSANLDTQLGDIPTVSELNARTLATASYFVAANDTVANVTTVGSVTTKTGYELAAAEDVYHADIDLRIDVTNTQDEYTVTWFKNGVRITSGITAPTIQVVKRADGTDLIASTAMTQIGSTGSYKYDETTNRTTAGEASLAIVAATIDSGGRTFARVVGRDSS